MGSRHDKIIEAVKTHGLGYRFGIHHVNIPCDVNDAVLKVEFEDLN